MYKIYEKNKLVYGVGINDANYHVRPKTDAGFTLCPYYSVWSGMLKRCYSDKYQNRRPTYKGCYVCKEWLSFSNFKSWMEKQDWQGKVLDKDLIVIGNKCYSPETSAFVDRVTNGFPTDCAASRGDLKIGASIRAGTNKFVSSIRHPLANKTIRLGEFNSEDEAHNAWKAEKHNFACMLADMQSDERVAKALRVRYL